MSKYSKLNARQIEEIKQRFAAGEDQSDIARSMGVNRQLVWYHCKAKPRPGVKAAKNEIEDVLA